MAFSTTFFIHTKKKTLEERRKTSILVNILDYSQRFAKLLVFPFELCYLPQARNYIRNRNNSAWLLNSIKFGMTLKYSATLYKEKTKIFLVTRPPSYWKSDSCFWFVRNGKNDKRICNKVCRSYSCDYFHVKISLKLLVKPLLHSVFSLIT